MTVRAAGRRLDVTVNGTRVLEADLDECAAKFPEHEGLQRTSGRIGLQMLRTVVEFRNVRVRELPAGQATSAASSAAGLVAGGNLVGTTWEVTDSDGDRYTWTFQADGVLHYQADRGLRTNGTWRKDGNAVHIETNSQYATGVDLASDAEVAGIQAGRRFPRAGTT
jgi:hypothetical protein